MNAHAMSEREDTARFGFWLYLLSDLMIFGALFAVYMILRGNTAGGPNIQDIVQPFPVLIQTIVLLTSSFTVAVAVLSARAGRLATMRRWLYATLLLGVTFLGIELYEFIHLVQAGESWRASAFLSSFFALVGTHGIHITIGLVWLIVWLVYYQLRGMSVHMLRRLGLFALFWHFLDIVWIWVFTIVYLFGAAGL